MGDACADSASSSSRATRHKSINTARAQLRKPAFKRIKRVIESESIEIELSQKLLLEAIAVEGQS